MTASPGSFDGLAERYRPELLAYLRRLLGNAHDAEDVCQDAFLRAYRAIDRLGANSNSRAWLYKVVTNTALNFMRRRRRATARAVNLEMAALPVTESENAERREQLRLVARAVRALPPRQRAALMQRKFHGLSYEEIAGTLGCSPEAARANVYQAIKKLRAALG